MNRRRRRIGKARRRKARLIREIRLWSLATGWAKPPKGGRLRVPVLAVMYSVDEALAVGMHALAEHTAMLRRFISRTSPQVSGGRS